MNWWTVFYLFASANISIIYFIAQGEATGNPEIELIEGSNLKTKTKGKQPQYEEAGSSSSVSHQRATDEYQLEYQTENFYTKGCSAETSEIEEIQKEGPSYSGEITYSDRKAWAVADVEEATHTTTTNLPYLERFGLLHYFASPEDKRKKEEKLSLCEQFIANRQTNPQELFGKYSDSAKLKLCRRAWVIYLLNNTSRNEMSVKQYEKEHTLKNIKGGPVFQKNVKCGNNKIVPNVTVVGCTVANKSCNVYKIFITPSISSDSYYIMLHYDLEEVDKLDEFELFTFVKDVKLEENLGSKSMFYKFGKMMSFKSQKTQND